MMKYKFIIIYQNENDRLVMNVFTKGENYFFKNAMAIVYNIHHSFISLEIKCLAISYYVTFFDKLKGQSAKIF